MKASPHHNIPLSIINMDATANIIGSMQNAEEMMNMFIKSLPETKHEFDVAFKAKDISELRDQCHKLTGSTAYCVTPHLIEVLKIFHALLIDEPENYNKWKSAYFDMVHAIEEVETTYFNAKP